MKKIISLLLCGVMMLGLVGCGKNIDRDSATIGQIQEYVKEELGNDKSSIKNVKDTWKETLEVLDAYGDSTDSTKKSEYEDILKNAEEVKKQIDSVEVKKVKNKLIREYCTDYMEFADRIVFCIEKACESASSDEGYEYFSIAVDIKDYTERQQYLYETYVNFSGEALNTTVKKIRDEEDLDSKLEEINKELQEIE